MRHLFIIACVLIFHSCGQDHKKHDKKLANDPLGAAESAKLNVADTSRTFLWRAMKFDSTINDSIDSIFLNKAYLGTMSDAEKAAIGYVSTFIGNECWWDGEANNDRSNLDCKISSALGLGYQCSDTHLHFLRTWFANDKDVLSELNKSNCSTTPYTATIQNTFDKIEVRTKADSIIVYYEASAINMRKRQSWKWSEKDYFTATTKTIELVKKEKSVVKQESFKMITQ